MIPTGNVKFALLVASKPPYNPMTNPQELAYIDFLNNMPRIEQPPPDTEKIHDNVWLIPLSTGMPFLSSLCVYAKAWNVPHRILFLDEKPEWIKWPPPDETPATP